MLCGFADAVPQMIARLLQQGAENNRDIGETSCTDLLMLAFSACKSAGISTWAPVVGARYSEERKTGADIEWWFVSPSDDTYLRLLVQCKRLYTRAGPSWSHRHRRAAHWGYDMLHHESPAGVLQAVTLADYARRPPDGFLSWPLYLFFNRADVPSPPQKRANGSDCAAVEGINLACGYSLEKHLLSQKSAAARRVTTVREWFWSMKDLFCPDPQFYVATAPSDDIMLFLLADAALQPTTSFGIVPHPSVIAERLARMVDAEVDGRPKTGVGIPKHIRNQLTQEGGEDRTTTGLKRIVFEHRSPGRFVDGRLLPDEAGPPGGERHPE